VFERGEEVKLVAESGETTGRGQNGYNIGAWRPSQYEERGESKALAGKAENGPRRGLTGSDLCLAAAERATEKKGGGGRALRGC